jgi:NAD(P)-dependent dehydrogenase (short-subunit alcohol dehydrogenase family)
MRRVLILTALLVGACALPLRPAGRRSVLQSSLAVGAASLPRCVCAAEGAQSLRSLHGTTCIVTGGHQGLGLEVASGLAAQGARVVITARKQFQTDRAIAALSASLPPGARGSALGVPLDLANLTSVRAFPARLAAGLGESTPAVDVLVANAQGESPFNSERTATADGFERQIGVSHLGHFALLCELAPALRRAAHGFRVISVTSEAHRAVTPSALFYALDGRLELPGDTTAQFERYRIAKAANVLFTLELRRRLEAAGEAGSAVALGLHDPRVDMLVPLEPAARLAVELAAAVDTGGDRARSGSAYYSSEAGTSVEPSAAALNPRYGRVLWTLSEALTSETAPYALPPIDAA